MEKVKKIFCSAKNFRLITVLCMFCANVAFIDAIAVWLLGVCIAWGAVILWQEFRDKKFLRNIQYYKVVFAFLIINVISFVLHINHNFLVGCVYILYPSVCFLTFYGAHARGEHDKLKEEMFLLFKIMVWVTLILSFLSISTLFISNGEFKGEFWDQYKKVFTLLGTSNIDLGGYTLGFYQRRLIGVYTNANLIGFSSAVGVVSATVLWYVKEKDKGEKIFPRFVLILCIIGNLLCLLLSDSNGSLLFIIIYTIVFVFCKVLINDDKFNFILIFKRILALCIVCILLVSGSFVVRQKVQFFIGCLVSEVNQVKDNIDNDILTPNKNIVNRILDRYELAGEDDEPLLVGRTEGKNGYNDVSSGRIDLWKQGLEIFAKHPVFGIGRANFEYYGEKYLPNGLRFPDVHNGYLSIAMANGGIGLLCFAFFGFLVALRITRKIFRKHFFDWSNVPYKLFSFIVTYCAYALIEITFLSQPFFETIIFWYMLGFIMSYIVEYERENPGEDDQVLNRVNDVKRFEV